MGVDEMMEQVLRALAPVLREALAHRVSWGRKIEITILPGGKEVRVAPHVDMIVIKESD